MQAKKLSDYYETMYNLFPEVNKKDISLIMNYGWKQLYLLNSYGGDICIRDKNFWTYFGSLTKDSLKHFNKYVLKLGLKIRIQYKRKKIPWDGFYYFALTDTQYQNYINQKNKRGRPKKYFNFGNVFLYKILNECKIKEHGLKYIFKIPYYANIGYKFYKKDLITDQAELIITRDPLKFEDILVTNNNYEEL